MHADPGRNPLQKRRPAPMEYAARGVRVPAPKLRYGAGHDGRWIPHQKTVIPQRTFDRLLRHSLHLPNPDRH